MRVTGPFWTLPNLLSVSRMAGLPLFFWALSTPGYTWLVAALVAYAVVSDLLDGYLARRFHQTSEWGRILDPLADKVTAACVLVYCYLNRGLPGWFLALALGRDVLILALAPVLIRRQHRLPASLLTGRLAALAVGLLTLVYLFDLVAGKRVMLAASTLLIFISAWHYSRRLFAHAD